MTAVAAGHDGQGVSGGLFKPVLLPLGLCLAVLGFVVTTAYYADRRQDLLEEMAGTIDSQTERLLDRQFDALFTLKTLLAASDETSRWTFFSFAQDIADHYPSLRHLAWVPAVREDERRALEDQAHVDGLFTFAIRDRDANGDFVTAPPRDRYYPVYYLEPQDRHRDWLGLDLVTVPELDRLLRQSARDGRTVLVRRATSGLADLEKTEVLAFMPVYDRWVRPSSDVRRSEANSGFLVVAFDIAHLLRQNLVIPAQGPGFELYLLDENAVPAEAAVATMRAGATSWGSSKLGPGELPRLRQSGVVKAVAGSPWTLVVRGATAPVGLELLVPWIAAALMLLLTLRFGQTIEGMLRRARLIERTVAERTEELRQSEDRYLALADISPAGVFHADAKGRCSFVNRKWQSLTGLDFAQAVDGKWLSVIDPEFREGVMRRWSGFVDSGEKFVESYRIIQPSGDAVWVLSEAVHRDQQDDASPIIGTMTDITEQKRRESELLGAMSKAEQASREARRAAAAAEAASKAKSEFLALMSHELRTPMTGVLGMADHLLRGDPHLAHREQIETIKQSGEALLEIINSILDLSKLETGKLELVQDDIDLAPLVEGVTALLTDHAAAKGLTLIADIADDLPARVRGDALRIRQILINLVGNAIKFSDAGQVRIAVERRDRETGAAVLAFTVSDQGIGISRADLPRLFDMFEQGDGSASRRFGGTGLGLAICNQLIGLMGGEISARSEVGKGSSFSFEVPLQGCDAVESEPRQRISGYEVSRPLHILVAEDNTVNQLVIKALLGQFGHVLTLVGDGREAVAALREEDFDLILMDVRMPHMDGPAATRTIRAMGGAKARVPIIAVTADAIVGKAEELLAAGMDAVTTKPIDQDHLLRSIDEVLGEVLHRPRFEADLPLSDTGAQETSSAPLTDLIAELDRLKKA